MKKESLFLPRRKNWKPGQHQIGLFIRSDSGAVHEAVWDNADPAVRRAAIKLLRGGR